MCKMCCVERVWFRKPVSYSSVWVRDGKEPGLRGSKELWEWMEQKKKSERFKPGNLRNTSLQGKGKGENTGARGLGCVEEHPGEGVVLDVRRGERFTTTDTLEKSNMLK